MTSYKPHNYYKQLINIAKGQLALPDDLYRANLKTLTGKTSLRDMTIPDLVMVLDHMQKSGFKIKATTRKSPTTSDKAEGTHTMLDKLRQVWIQMNYQGLIKNGSEKSLQTWAGNQSKRLNKGVAINKLEWLPGNILYALIEQLKKWHLRMLGEVFTEKLSQVKALHKNNKLNYDEFEELSSLLVLFNSAPNTHEIVSNTYSYFLQILEQHKSIG